jgi:hypothetical protein
VYFFRKIGSSLGINPGISTSRLETGKHASRSDIETVALTKRDIKNAAFSNQDITPQHRPATMTSGLDDALCIHRSGAGTTREQQRDRDKVDNLLKEECYSAARRDQAL